MNFLKRSVSLFLALVFMATLFSCGGKEPSRKKEPIETTAKTSADTEETLYYEPDELPEDLDFDGAVVTFLSQGKEKGNWFYGEITVEDYTNEVINDSVYNRELYVEDRINVNIENVLNDEDYAFTVNKMINSGEDNYQILCQSALRLSGYGLTGYLNDLYEVANIDLDKPWWSAKFNEEAEIMDHLYLSTGSLSLSLKRFLFAVFYNKKVAEDNYAKIPELEHLYDIVESGKWTFDKMLELGGDIYVDLNGNSEHDAEDYYGIGFNSGIDVDILWSSFDINVFSKDEDGWFALDVDTDKMYNGLNMVFNLLNKTDGCYNPGNGDYDLVLIDQMLAADSLLFGVDRIYAIESEVLRNMQHDYGILPTPKYDERQSEYYSYAHDQYTAFAIPTTCADTSAAGAVLEAMASYSYRDTEPAYLNMALKGKYMNDMQSRRMIDLVVNGFKVDSVWIYIHDVGGEFTTNFRSAIANGKNSFASEYAVLEKKLAKTLPVSKKEMLRIIDR